MDKSGIKNFAIEARKILRESAIKKAGMYGITIDNISEPVQKLSDSEVFKTIAGDEIRLFEDDLKKRNNLVSAIRSMGFEQVIEETAYTWFNRLIAIRFMEVNDYLPSRVRVLSSEAGGSTPDIVRDAFVVDLNLSQEELDKIQKAKEENRYDDAFQMLFVKQCNELNAILPGLFEKTDDYMELLLDISYTGDGVVRMLNSMIQEDDFNVESQGQVEIIGWMYQYYNTELKDDTFAKLKKNIKITKERIPAATQLFTPDWIVRYMVENSLGRVWIDHMRAVDETVDEKAKAEEFGWQYYLPEAEQEEEVAAELVKVRTEYKDLKPQDILCIDPCSGSGHILVYMFDVLLAIYESEGISERDAVFDILEKNIFGLDIDKRAYQLSYFALMMKGRGVAGRRFFRGVEDENGERRPIQLNVYAIDESNGVDMNILDAYGVSMPAEEREKAKNQVSTLLAEMNDAKEYGSIINVTDFDMELVKRYLADREESGQLNIQHIGAGQEAEKITRLAKIGKALAQKYDAVVTNPPYMGPSNGTSRLHKYVMHCYSDEKSDLFAVFIKKANNLLKRTGFQAMITMHAWMFQQSFFNLRKDSSNWNHVSFLHLGARAFDEINGEIVQTVAFTLSKTCINDYKALYFDLRKGNSESEKKQLYLNRNSVFRLNSKFLYELPGMVFAYWITEKTLNVFRKSKTLSDFGMARRGLQTGDATKFIRLWYEIDYTDLTLPDYFSNPNELKWVLENNGGSVRKWYNTIINVVLWQKNGFKIKNHPSSIVPSEDLYFRKCITWNKLTTKGIALKLQNKGIIPGDLSPFFIADNEEKFWYCFGFLNSSVARYLMQVLNPSITTPTGDVAKVPVIYDINVLNAVKEIDEKCVELSRLDSMQEETSWEFVRASLVARDTEKLIQECYDNEKNVSKKRFTELKNYEQKLNLIFANVYNLIDDVSINVDSKDITIKCIFDDKNDIPEELKGAECVITKKDLVIRLISYSVGCMFGRYSLDEEGLIYAGGKFDSSRYKSFPADEDAIIPITDEEYFDDDIVKRFVEFVTVVYGEETLEANLQFIADALGNKGDTSREVIRNYFLNDFFKDHAKTYSVTGSGKRPIYWLFDSGKQNGFKCLIYMHRYTPDTVGLIRSVYLKKESDAIQKALDNAEYIIANTESNVDRALSTKKRDKYVKQLAEIKPYYQALSHVAMQRIELDLDDGVKVNYAKFQGIEVGGDGEKKQTINLLAKI